MKININKVKLTPENYGFNFCQYGELSDELKEWSNHWKFKQEKLGSFTNISIENLNPSFLFKELVEHSKDINKHYEKMYIKNNPENVEFFSNLISDLEFGMLNLGMFSVEKV